MTTVIAVREGLAGDLRVGSMRAAPWWEVTVVAVAEHGPPGCGWTARVGLTAAPELVAHHGARLTLEEAAALFPLLNPARYRG